MRVAKETTMEHIIYVSSAVTPFSEDQLVKLLSISRRNNASLGVSGMLLYKDGNFMQYIEGDAQKTNDLFVKISGDGRHRGIITLARGPIGERLFSDWSMGFRNLEDPTIHSIIGYNEFKNVPLSSATFQGSRSNSMKLLSLFRKNMR